MINTNFRLEYLPLSQGTTISSNDGGMTKVGVHAVKSGGIRHGLSHRERERERDHVNMSTRLDTKSKTLRHHHTYM